MSDVAIEIFDMLMKTGVIKTKGMNSYQKTEQLLKDYKYYHLIIDNKEKRKKEIIAEGILKGGVPNETRPINTNYKSDLEKMEDKLNKLEIRTLVTEKCLFLIEEALKTIKKDKYYTIIELLYFEKKPAREVAEILEVDESTISRNKRRLIKILRTQLVPDDLVTEILF